MKLQVLSNDRPGSEVSATKEAMNLCALMMVVLALSSSEGVPLSGCDGENDCADASDLLQIHAGESPSDGQQVAEFAQDQNRSICSADAVCSADASRWSLRRQALASSALASSSRRLTSVARSWARASSIVGPWKSVPRRQ